MAQIALVDDHTVFRQAIARYLCQGPGRHKVLEASNGSEGLHLLTTTHIDLVLLDIQMPVMGGLEMLVEMKRRKIETPVIILSMMDNAEFVFQTTSLDVQGYLPKNCDLSELDTAISGVLEGRRYFSKYTLTLIEDSGKGRNRRRAGLSPRESQILELIRNGMSNKEIAVFLNLELNTIESYRKSLMRKTSSRSVADLIAFAYKLSRQSTARDS